jgi:hypothetical protein
MGLFLGSVFLDGFEIAARITFGGAQAMAVHKLPGGTRVIDAMGADDAVIAWHGILSGNDATDRARALDALRIGGLATPLSWDVFSATVIVSELKLEFCNSWWIPYQIACTVLIGTQTATAATAPVTLLADIVADLNLAASAPGVALALAAVNAAGATVAGSQAYAAASSALTSTGGSITAAIASTEPGMTTTDLPSLVASAGSLASLTAASGYVGRATTNFLDAGF